MVKNRQKQDLKANSFKRSGCPVACTLDIIGDKWTLLIIRDLIKGKSRYNQFLESREGITTNILASRLKFLEQSGLLKKTPYQDNPVRYNYRLTELGESIRPVIRSIISWANENIPGTHVPKKYLVQNRLE